ncbi:hypothetical protein ABT117_27010 [Streptomyces sp. NPDC002262]|uniref:hypothetical protein n=1 Tax=Streptomyces sp. NPDC002262 TaxID=3154414 RepID=UPI003328C6D6
MPPSPDPVRAPAAERLERPPGGRGAPADLAPRTRTAREGVPAGRPRTETGRPR